MKSWLGPFNEELSDEHEIALRCWLNDNFDPKLPDYYRKVTEAFFIENVSGARYTNPAKPKRSEIEQDLERLRSALKQMSPFTRRYLDACLVTEMTKAGMCDDSHIFEISEFIFSRLERTCEAGYGADPSSSKRKQAKELVGSLLITYELATHCGSPAPSSATINPFYKLVIIGLDCIGIPYEDPQKLILEVLKEKRLSGG
ncbi:hypothetical protein [Pontiella sulfatireligans]|uniref:Uncharacterized protein n=1 Tax=Pontiella sulfatireligans TaxID=2750658 RepID=A0A6C2UMH3_9BACT|nr:hypothetical protein [Pontiella sulfatireligans]VGO21123.1 hypothetical protein SCARR_03193 [Pontiella sulfatireligans]